MGDTKQRIHSPRERGLRALFMALMAFLLVLGIWGRSVAFEIVPVQGASMQPTLQGDEWVLVLKTVRTKEQGLRRGDLALCHFDGQPQAFVKRVVALPGDVVQLIEGELYVDSVRQTEEYVQLRGGLQNIPESKLGEDEYYLLGDQREISNDSRALGPVAAKRILGKVCLVLWPLGRSLSGTEVRS